MFDGLLRSTAYRSEETLSPSEVQNPVVPFGGYMMSGHGREMGSYVLDLYTEVKCTWSA
jgi:acyl-CoA reductase-like NAD-dependent aldehyde dehydrogenase